MPMTPKKMVKILKRHGYVEISQNGSHLKLRNSVGSTIIVPMHRKDFKKVLEQALLKEAGLR